MGFPHFTVFVGDHVCNHSININSMNQDGEIEYRTSLEIHLPYSEQREKSFLSGDLGLMAGVISDYLVQCCSA